MSQLVRLEGKHTTQSAHCAMEGLHPQISKQFEMWDVGWPLSWYWVRVYFLT